MAKDKDDIPTLTLEVLKDIRGDMREMKADMHEMKRADSAEDSAAGGFADGHDGGVFDLSF